MPAMNKLPPSELKKYLAQIQVTPMELIIFIAKPVLKRKWLLLFNIAILILLAFLNFVIPQFSKNIIDTAIPAKNVSMIVQQILLLLGATLAIGILGFVNAFFMQRLSLEAITEVRAETYDSLIYQDLSYFQNAKTGDLMVRLTSDIQNIQMLVSNNTFSLLSQGFTFVGILGFLYWKDWRIALLITITFPLLYLNIQFSRKRIREANAKLRQNLSRISNQLQTTFTTIELIKEYTTEDYETNKFDAIIDEGNNFQLNVTKWQNVLSSMTSLINGVGTAIIIGFGSYLVIQQKFTVGDLVAYIGYMALLQAPISLISQVINNFQNALVSYDNIQGVFRVQRKVVTVENPVPFPIMENAIQLDQVSFQYEEDQSPILNQLSFDIPIGQTTALVGRSGAGKSTLIKLLTRMYDPTGGEISFDGVEIRQMNLKELRQNISVVSQDVIILDGTIADNIRYGSFQADEEQIWASAELADIAEFIKTLPAGLETQVGERGIKLSGGQKQRLSIARAFLKNAPIVILDEATAALDNEAEKLIQHAFDNLMKGRTSIVIAHRLSTIHSAAQIIVLDEGKMMEKGTHQELLEKSGLYKFLYDMQFE